MLAGIAAVSAALLMTELALTRIFSVTMSYHFAFLAISIALFGLSASGVFVYVMRGRLSSVGTRELLTAGALAHAVVTVVALACLVHIRVGLNYSTGRISALMLAIYTLAALPFFAGGAVHLAGVRKADGIDQCRLCGGPARGGGRMPRADSPAEPARRAGRGPDGGRPGRWVPRVCFAPHARRPQVAAAAVALFSLPAAAHAAGGAPFDVVDTKGHEGDRILFSKWNSFSRVAVYDRAHGDWSLSPRFTGSPGESLFMWISTQPPRRRF